MSDREQSRDSIQRWARGLRVYVGRDRLYSVEVLAETSGVPARAIYAIMAGEYAPRWCEGMALCRVLGPAFTNSLLEPHGMTGVHRIETDPADPHRHLSRMAEEVADLAHKLEDGLLDHIERPDCAGRLRQLGVECIETAAALSDNRVHLFRAKRRAS